MRFLILFLCCNLFLTLSSLAQASADAHKKAVLDQMDHLEGLYLDLHQAPELSFYEYKTSERMAEELESLGLTVHTKIGGNGLIGVMENGPGKTIMIRADMDALPIVEDTGLPYASTVTTEDELGNTVGVMHACGHDVHMSVLIGTARVLHQIRDQWSGTAIFLAQPAEERSGGAKAMLADGLFDEHPVPDFALALHVNASMQAGKVGFCPEYIMANVDMMDITVYGEGGTWSLSKYHQGPGRVGLPDHYGFADHCFERDRPA